MNRNKSHESDRVECSFDSVNFVEGILPCIKSVGLYLVCDIFCKYVIIATMLLVRYIFSVEFTFPISQHSNHKHARLGAWSSLFPSFLYLFTQYKSKTSLKIFLDAALYLSPDYTEQNVPSRAAVYYDKTGLWKESLGVSNKSCWITPYLFYYLLCANILS